MTGVQTCALPILSTQSDRENAWLITLVDVMEDTIRHFEGVQDASLTISLGEDRRYILDDSNITKASAALKIGRASCRERV